MSNSQTAGKLYVLPNHHHPLLNQLRLSLAYPGRWTKLQYARCQICGEIVPIDQVERLGKFQDRVCGSCLADFRHSDGRSWQRAVSDRLDDQDYRYCGACGHCQHSHEFSRIGGYWLCESCLDWVVALKADGRAKLLLRRQKARPRDPRQPDLFPWRYASPKQLQEERKNGLTSLEPLRIGSPYWEK